MQSDERQRVLAGIGEKYVRLQQDERQLLLGQLAQKKAELKRLDAERAELTKVLDGPLPKRRIIEDITLAPFTIARGEKWVTQTTATQAMSPDQFTAQVCENILRGRTTVLFADEVADELRAVFDNDGGKADSDWAVDNLMDVPNVMLPFDSLWVEGRVNDPNPATRRRSFEFGVLVTSQPYQPTMLPYGATIQSLSDVLSSRHCIAYICFSVYVRFGPGPVHGPIGHGFSAITPDYRLLKIDEELRVAGESDEGTIGRPLIVYTLGVPLPKWMDGNDKSRGMHQALIHCGTAMAVRAIGLLNCSNVEVVPEDSVHPKATRKRRADLARIKYHVLKVRIGKTLHPVQAKAPTGEGVALHLVRGHFKDFSRGRGAFGREKLRKSLWCPSFVRGSADHGLSVHDYELTPNEGGDK